MSQEHQENKPTPEPQEENNNDGRYHKDSAMRDLARFINKKLVSSKKQTYFEASESKNNNNASEGENNTDEAVEEKIVERESVEEEIVESEKPGEEDPTPSEIEDFEALQKKITQAVEVEVWFAKK